MDITITWSDGGGYQTTDGWNILYREHTPTNINSWILATDPDLPPTPTQYTLTGLTPNVLYDVAVVKSCAASFDVMSQRIYSYMSCPVVATWQGPVVDGKPTLFYSVYYEEGTDIGGVQIRLYESTPNVYQIVDAIGNGLDILFATGSVHDLEIGSEVVVAGINPPGYDGTYVITSKTASAFVVDGTYTGSYISGGQVTYTPGMIGDIGNNYPKVNSVVGKTSYQVINPVSNPLNYLKATNCATDVLSIVTPNNLNSVAGYFGTEHIINAYPYCDGGAGMTYSPILLDYNTTINPREYKLGTVGQFDFAGNLGPNNEILILGERCASDSITEVTTSFTFDDDATLTYRNLNTPNYANISFANCYDSGDLTLALTAGDGTGRTNINDYNFQYNLYDTSFAGPYPYITDAGLTITSNHILLGVFAEIQSISPGFNTYFTNNIDLTIELVGTPNVTVLSLTGEDYSTFTTIAFLNDIASKINTIGTYTAVVYLYGGSYYLRIYHSDNTITGISFLMENVINTPIVINPAIPQVNFTSTYKSIYWPAVYNGFIYGPRLGDSTQCNIQVSEIATATTSQYNHTIDFTVSRLALVPSIPGTVYPIYNIEDGKDIAVVNVAINPLTDDYYLISDTTIYLYDSTDTLISSETFAILTITADIKYVCYDHDLNIVYLFDDTNTVYYVQYAMSTWTYIGSNSYGGYTEEGGIVYNSTDGYVYMSIGDGEIAKIDSATGLVATYQMLEPDLSDAQGAFHLAVYIATGTVYAIKRDTTTGATKNIYTLDTAGNISSIDGSLYWDVNICGALSFNSSRLYFTDASDRLLYYFDIGNPAGYLGSIIPNIYNRLDSTAGAEKLMNAQYLGGDKFLMMSKVNNGGGEYDIVNLFIYDSITEEVEVIAGAPDEAYGPGLPSGWNTNSYGVAIGYRSGNIDNYSSNLNIIVNPNNESVYFKVNATTNTRIYCSKPVVESGVAQLWGTIEGGPDLIRIWNIQSDGSIVPSAKNIFQKANTAGGGGGIYYMKYDGYYDAVMCITTLSDSIVMFRPKSFTSWAGSDSNPLTVPYALGIGFYGNYAANDGLFWANHFMTNDAGNIVLFANHWPNPSGCGLTLITPAVVNGQINSTYPTTPNFCGNFSQGYYVPTTDAYWRYGQDGANVVIRVYNNTLTTFTTINLTALGYPITASGSFLLMSYDSFNDKIWLYNGVTKLVFNTSTLALEIVYTLTNSGTIIFYDASTAYIDYLTGTPFEESWGTIGNSPINVTGPSMQYLETTYDDGLGGTNTVIYDLYNGTSGIIANTFGQWKEITDTTWATIPSSITVTLGTRIEFTSFILDKPLVEVRNITQSTTFTSTSISGVPLIGLLADNIILNNGDVLEFEFTNPDDTSCPFINSTTITII
jgi:hypothetical protein